MARRAETIAATAIANGNFGILVQALQKAGLVEAMSGKDPYTVFAPTDAAFGELLKDLGVTADQLLENPDLKNILLYHVVAGTAMSRSLGQMVTTVQGSLLPVGMVGRKVQVGRAVVTAADVTCKNGVIHVIDKVLLPPKTLAATAVANGNFNILIAALEKAGLVETLSGKKPYTVFAPTDAAFGDLLSELGATAEQLLAQPDLKNILLHHVSAGILGSRSLKDGQMVNTVQGSPLTVKTAGSKVSVGRATVTAVDVLCSNGLIHAINKVLLPPRVPKTIVATAMSNGNFNILVAALQKAGLEATVSGKSPYTVFAPTDAAFGNLLKELGVSADQLLANPDLKKILLYHVVGGTTVSKGLKDGQKWATASGDLLPVKVDNGKVQVGRATVTMADISCTNGIIHVIDQVLLPPAELKNIAATAVENGNFGILVAALQKADLVETVSGKTPYTVFAPTDAAFSDLLQELGVTADALLANPDLKRILLYHVVPGTAAMSKNLKDGQLVGTAMGSQLTVKISDKSVQVGRATVTAPDVACSNGVIHVIDKVLLPPPLPKDIASTAIANGNFDILVAALKKADLVETMSGSAIYTVFAPTDAAFVTLLDELGVTADELLAKPDLKDILLHHVTEGISISSNLKDGQMVTTLQGNELPVRVADGKVQVGRATVTAADVACTNGVIHVIDKVLLLPAPPQNIAATAMANGNFGTLVAALRKAGLVDTVSGRRPYTVFAPTDAAFADLLQKLGITADKLLADPELKNILLYHVVGGTTMSGYLRDGQVLPTLQGSPLPVKVSDGKVRVGKAMVTAADVACTNGVIHVIDRVLVPPPPK